MGVYGVLFVGFMRDGCWCELTPDLALRLLPTVDAHRCAWRNGAFLVFGGYTGTQFLSDIWRYDPQTAVFAPIQVRHPWSRCVTMCRGVFCGSDGGCVH